MTISSNDGTTGSGASVAAGPLPPADVYRLLIDSIKDYAIYMLSPAGIVTSWNSGAQRLKGYTASEIIGSHFSQFYGAEDRAAGLPARALQNALNKGKFENEGWRIRKDGTRFWAYVIIEPIWTATGELAGFAKITRDLTERRAAEEKLRSSQEQFQLLVEGVSDYALYMLGTDGRIRSWNSGAQRIKQYSADEVLETHFSRFYTPEDRERGEPARALEVATREGRFEKEGLRVRKDGSRFWANVVIDAVRANDGSLIGFAKITRDITVQRDARIALERTRESLFQIQKMEAIGQLTGGVAHDFNNLLTAILGSLELLRKRLPDDPKMIGLLDNAVAGARRGAALTQRMLAFARRQDLVMESIDLSALVRGMSELFDRSLDPGVALEIRFPRKLAPVNSDANQLELALLNLVVNARDAMPSGGTIVIAAREVQIETDDDPSNLPAGRYVCVSVTDTGEGMDEATLARAGEPFFTTKGIGKGTGLGLPMVHGVAQQSGGRLQLQSRKGAGTCAEIWLPVAKYEARQTMRSAPSGYVPSEPQVVLAVDDDMLVLSNTIALLEDLGHTAIAANSASDALRILRSDPRITLVITDHVMPQMTGAQLAEQLQRERPDLRLVLASGYAELSGLVPAGVQRLAKPFDREALARVLAPRK